MTHPSPSIKIQVKATPFTYVALRFKEKSAILADCVAPESIFSCINRKSIFGSSAHHRRSRVRQSSRITFKY
jgi:hypothetical protein